MAQTTSKLWKSLWRMSNTEREYKFEINGVEYGPDQEVEHSYSNGLFEDFGHCQLEDQPLCGQHSKSGDH